MEERGDSASSARPHPHTSTFASAPNLNHLWAGLLVEELVRQGVGLFVVHPGSRSTPLAVAIAQNPRAQALVHFDERGGAFAALGWARATGRPAAWVTTSGTAVANGLPAAVEAATDGVPLLLLTADRPPELRETGANQTVRQPGIFGSYTRWAFDLPPPSAEVPAALVLTTAAQAVARSLVPPGPVHLNLPFREPLAPERDGTDAAALLGSLARWLDGDAPFTRYPSSPPVPDDGAVVALAERLESIERGLVAVGKTDDPRLGAAASRLAARLGWPLLPDVGSHARLGPAGGTVVPHYDLVLGSAAFRDAHRPDAVVHLGGRFTSKRLAQHLEAAAPETFVVVRADAERLDPAHQVTDRFAADPAAFADALADELLPRAAPTAWLSAWQSASDAVAHALDAAFADDALTEPRVARAVSRGVAEGDGLVVAASMPVRDLDAFGASGRAAVRVAANRGASGIDGTVATAAGFARGLGRRATLLVGDLALLHDLNSLALLREGPPVVVVVVNNDGGGIFSFLPVARHEAVFETYFGTPHGLGFEDAARMFGLAYARPTTAPAFEEALGNALALDVSTLIEVRTERAANAYLHRALVAQCAAAVDAALRL